jgi:hypothetical protein
MLFYMREVELNILVKIKVFKQVDEMTDREMFHEYEKMRKQSYMVKRLYRNWFRAREASSNVFALNSSLGSKENSTDPGIVEQ